ncbi:extracellular solute-binding protein [Bifidobacterium mongoliense]|uniref:ABC transporter substrate-binding protein n=2 Tax=Bifidobacterium mongoliense TaxID=518643 RepID=A0A087C7A9_9BIFI|nr:extracellular solute-binding protein [Bifidobacterium mongoliense]KFI79159.1 ABC transporter substrate-binding protein [Bifidobacterium mongoliense DSM 21395]
MMKKSVVWKVGALACASLVTLAGCGSGSSGATENGKPVVTVAVTKDARAEKMEKMAWTKDLQKDCGCTIKWQEVAGSSWDQQKKAALAAGEVADVTIGGYGAGDMGQYGSLFLDLKPELKNMPNLSKMFKAEPYSKVISTGTNGKIQGAPTVDRPTTARTSNHMFINKQWLDKLGLKVPTTWAELETDLKAFKTQDPNGNGKADEVPMDFNSPSTGGFGLFSPNVLLASQGIVVPNGALGMYAQDGKIKNYLTDSRYKDLITYMHQLWSDGVISSEAFTHDWSKYTGTAKGNGTTATVGFTWMWTPSDIFGTKIADQYVTIPSLKASDGQSETPVWAYNGDELAYKADTIVVSSAVKNKEAALKLVDAFYAPDMSIQARYGAFGSAVKKNAVNDYKVLDAPAGQNVSDWQFYQSLSDGAPGWISDDMKLELPAAQSEVKGVDKVYDNDYKNVNFNKDVLYANMPMTEEQTNTMNSNNTGITQYAMSKFATWVTKGGVDKDWDTYVSYLKKNKLDDNIKIQQQVYDAFQKNMHLIGVNLNDQN